MIKSLNYDFDRRVLYINNVKNRQKVLACAEKYRQKREIDDIIFTDDIAESCLGHFGMTEESFRGGYWYSIQELCGILNCGTKYLLHMTGDSIITTAVDWINPAIERMEKDASVFVANPNGDPRDVMENLVEEEKDFYRGYGFSDQCYLIRADDFKRNIYNETHEASKRYPSYGGELFEKRVDSYMRNHGLFRLTSKAAMYRHQNFPKDPIRRLIAYYTGINLKKGR